MQQHALNTFRTVCLARCQSATSTCELFQQFVRSADLQVGASLFFILVLIGQSCSTGRTESRIPRFT